MANDQDRNQDPTTGKEADISKAQSQQQPQGQAGERTETGEEAGQFEGADKGQQQFGQDLGSAAPDEGQQGETLSEQRTDTDIEGASGDTPERGEAESGFVGSQGQKDSSGELVEDEELDKDDQGTPDAE